ncbi:MAG: manganese efflux pump MntP family protein [Candidatus Bathyarchaeia archaeon]
MDCFSVSITNGLKTKRFDINNALRIAVFFGLFQAVMPIIGWLAGYNLINYIAGFDHWAAFGLLTFIGCRMVYESTKTTPKKAISSVNIYVLLMLSVATSLDALAVGLGLSFLKVSVWTPAITIGIITLFLSFLGVYIGYKFASFFKNKIELLGGLILIGIGIKILIDHLMS